MSEKSKIEFVLMKKIISVVEKHDVFLWAEGGGREFSRCRR